MTFEEKLKLLRKTHGLRQVDLADRMGVSAQTVSKWEHSQKKPDIDQLLALSRTFGVTVDQLVNDDIAIDWNVAAKASAPSVDRPAKSETTPVTPSGSETSSKAISANSDFITNQILSTVKNVESLDLDQLKNIRNNLQKLVDNRLLSSSQKIKGLLNSSLETVNTQIFIKEEEIQKERERREEEERIRRQRREYEARVRRENAQIARANRKAKVVDFISTHDNSYLSVDEESNRIIPSKKLIKTSVAAFCIMGCLGLAMIALIIGAIMNWSDKNDYPPVNSNINIQSTESTIFVTESPTEAKPTEPVPTTIPADIVENVVNIKIDCDSNWFFDKYDLIVWLNDEEQGYIDHGGTESFQFNLDDGTHTIILTNENDSSIKGEATFTITDDTDIEYNVSCYSEKIGIYQTHFENMRPLEAHEAKIPNAPRYYTKNKTYQSVEAELTAAGFTNIQLKSIRDLDDYEESDVGKVEAVSFGGNTSYNAGEIVNKDIEIIITYHELEPTADEVQAIIDRHKGEPAENIIAALADTGYSIKCYVQDEEITEFNPNGYLYQDGTLNNTYKIASLNFTTQELIDMGNSLEAFLPQGIAERVAVVAMTNGQATDVYYPDGNTLNPAKFHKYSDISGFYMSVFSSGNWKVIDATTWHVTDMKCMISGYSTCLKASMDITFDGTNYIVSNVDKTMAAKDHIDSDDPSKVNTEHLEPSNTNLFLTVSPSLVAEDRDSSAELDRNNKTMPTSTRTSWIDNQFSFWTGEHKQLKDMITANLKDENSYDHINTSYYDLLNQELVDSVNQILKDSGYSQRVELGDLFIVCEFSAKNSFNATIKNMAYGIAHYDENTIELIGIE